MRGTGFFAVFMILLLLSVPISAQVIDLDIDGDEDTRPEIWKKAKASDIRRAEEAARKDACLRLVESAYMLTVSSTRDVLDLMIKNDTVNQGFIKELGKTKALKSEYLEDGTVRTKVCTIPKKVAAILKKLYSKVAWDLSEEDHVIAAIESQAARVKKNMVLYGEGEGALKGSRGAKRIPVRRAAKVEAEKDIMVKILKLVLYDYQYSKQIRDFALKYEHVPAKMALGMSTARIHSEEWQPDGSVKMQVEVDVVKVTRLVYTAQRLYAPHQYYDSSFYALVTSTKDMIFNSDRTAKAGAKGPKNGTLELESEAVDEALKVKPPKRRRLVR